MNDEIKEWQTQSVKHKVAYVLMMDGISFRYGVSLKPIINEYK